jgi:3-hydroxyisobutyrate dehydrogenase-like beta-hydroxyacid dehydrogenase
MPIGEMRIAKERVIEILVSLPITSSAAGAAAKGMLAENFAPLFPINLVQKDFAYALHEAGKLGGNMPITAAAERAFHTAAEHGLGVLNITGISQLYGDN